MEGWLYGVFSLAGVLVGGFFTYLGLKAKLKQQKDINNTEWRRKVRSEPLLKLKEELAVITTNFKKLVFDTRRQNSRSDISEEEKSKKLELAIKDLDVILDSGDFLKTINLQVDRELSQAVDNIVSKYSLLFEYALHYKDLRGDLRAEFSKMTLEIDTKIPEIQSLINKKLEEL